MPSGMFYFYLALFAFTCIILLQTAYTDVKRRTINSFIFIPLVALGAVFHWLNGAPDYYVIIGILVFLATFLETDLVIYPIIGFIFLISSLYLFATGGYYYGFTLIVISLMYIIGFQERLFGIGDVKAMVAIFFTFTQFPFLTPITSAQAGIQQVMPLSIVMLFNIAVISLFFIPYVVLVNRRRGESMGLQSLTSMRYDEKIFAGNEAKFNVRDTPGGKIMVYKTPFMVSVGLGFILTVIAGFWFVYL